MKPSLKSIFFGEGTVPQGSADERPLHGAPTYYYPTGRSLPKHLQDRGGKSSARKWNEDGALLDVDELEDKQEKKKRWYQKEQVELFHNTSKRIQKLKPVPNNQQKIGDKPKGFWYSCGHEWLRWVNIEMPKWKKKYNYKIEIDYGRVLQITSFDGLVAFTKKYGESLVPGRRVSVKHLYPNWERVARDYSGIEICPYISKARFKLSWYYGWDVASGCIWDPTAVKQLEPVKISKRDIERDIVDESVGVDQKGFKLSMGALRQDSFGSTSASEKSSRTTSSGRTKKRSRKTGLKEFNALSTAAIEASNTPPGSWDRDNAPRVDQKKIKANKAYVKKLDVTSVEAANGTEVHVDHLDPQYKRQISMLKSPEDVIEWKEPNYLEGRGDHRISQLGYAKIADRQNDLKMDVYLAPYDPNWKRSEDMMQQVIKHWIANHGNPKRIMPEPDATMMVSIKEAWEDLRDTFKEYYPHDPAVNYHETKPGVEGEFYSITEDYYHGTNKEFAPGDYIMPPSETGEISEKGRKKNLDKVFFTLDKGSAKIYAGRAVQSFGSGSPNIYKVQPIGDIEWLNKQKGTTVLMAPMAKVIEKVSS